MLVNTIGQYADGVAKTDPDTGTTTIRPDKLAILQRHFPVNPAPIEPSKAWQRAHELHAAFTSLQSARSAA